MLSVTTHSPAETDQLGMRLGKFLEAGDVICLSGSLGAGKTCLAAGLARGWGALEQPTSPTFMLINEYHRANDANRLWHVDCYRLVSTADAISTGLGDIFSAPGIVVIEWPERIREMIPSGHVWINMQMITDALRAVTLEPHGDHATKLLSALSL